MNMRALTPLLPMLIALGVMAQTTPTIEWQRCLGGTAQDYANAIQQTTDGGSIMAGITYSNNGNVTGGHGLADFWLVKLNAEGAMEWERTYGGSSFDEASSIEQTTDEGYIIGGETISNNGDVTGNHGQKDVWIVKVDNMGSIQWERSYGGSNSEYSRSIQQTSDGGYIVAAETRSMDGDVTFNHGGPDCWVLKLDATGEIQWQRTYGGTGYDGWAPKIGQTGDGGYLLCASSTSTDGDVEGNHGGYDFWVVKLDVSGTIQWQQSLGGPADEYASKAIQTADGGYMVVGGAGLDGGEVSGNHGSQDYWVVKLDSVGLLEWQACYGGSEDDLARDVIQLPDGGFLVPGATLSSDGDVTGNHGASDAWLLRLQSDGTLLWQKAMGGPGHDGAEALVASNQGQYLMAGVAETNGGDVAGSHGAQDCWVVKLGPDPVAVAQVKDANPPPLFPNPAADAVFIPFQANTSVMVQLDLFDAGGKMLRTQSKVPLVGGENTLCYSTKNLPAGEYVLHITSAARKLIYRFVKQ